MTHTIDQDRAEFEAWLAPEYSREKWHTGEYTDDYVYGMFAAWQAARRTHPPEDGRCKEKISWRIYDQGN